MTAGGTIFYKKIKKQYTTENEKSIGTLYR